MKKIAFLCCTLFGVLLIPCNGYEQPDASENTSSGSRVRILGRSEMGRLNGRGLTVIAHQSICWEDDCENARRWEYNWLNRPKFTCRKWYGECDGHCYRCVNDSVNTQYCLATGNDEDECYTSNPQTTVECGDLYRYSPCSGIYPACVCPAVGGEDQSEVCELIYCTNP